MSRRASPLDSYLENALIDLDYLRAELASGTTDAETLLATAKTLQNCAARLKREAEQAAVN